MESILIIEDDRILRKYLKEMLSKSYNIIVVEEFENIIEEIKQNNFDLVLLDLNLPGIYGGDLVSILKNKNAKILVMTSNNTTVSEISLLKLGVDDYIKKPLDIDILKLRIEKIFGSVESGIIFYEDIEIDANKLLLNEQVKLTKNDLIILLYLVKNVNQIIDYKTLLRQLWENDEFVEKSALMMAITRLRKKLVIANVKTKIITIRGKGVKLK